MSWKYKEADFPESEIQPMENRRWDQARMRNFCSFLSLEDSSEAGFPSTTWAGSHVATQVLLLSNWLRHVVAYQETEAAGPTFLCIASGPSLPHFLLPAGLPLHILKQQPLPCFRLCSLGNSSWGGLQIKSKFTPSLI